MPSCKLSIIVVCYKNYSLTLECLKSIHSFAPSFSYEIICVDNCSADGIEKRIAKDFPNVRFFHAGYNSGFSKANNLGIINSHGQYIMLLNNDTKVTQPFLDKLIEFMSAHPKVGALGPYHSYGDGRFQFSYGKFPTILTDIKRQITQYRILHGDSAVGRRLKEFCSMEREVDWLSGSCLLLRREALCQTGLLDEALFMYLEDVDLCTRILNRGWRVCYFPEVAIVHYHGRSVRENVLMCGVEYRRSQLHFAKKYYGQAGEIFIRAFLFFKFLIIGFGSVLKFCLFKIFKRDAQADHARIILSCKVIGMAFLSKASKPVEPALKA